MTIPVEPVALVASDFVGLSTERLEAELTTFAAHLAAATCAWLLMVAEYDRRGGFRHWECVSMEQWLSIHTGLSPSTARAHVGVARRLGELPGVRAAFAQGRLSYSKVRALCRVACAENEADWIDTAIHASGAQLERITADVRRVLLAQQHGVSAAQQDQRRFNVHWTDEGMLRVDGLLPPEVGVVLMRLLAEQREINDEVAIPGEELSVRSADAFAELVDRIGPPHETGADGLGECGRRALVVVHREVDGSCRLEGGPPIPADVADQLACGADTVVATHSTDGITFSNRRRFASVGLRRYLKDRDRCCVVPGCGQQRRLHAHHIREYCQGGETTRNNLVMLCPQHHGAIHRRGWRLSGDPENGTLIVVLPDGRSLGPSRIVGNPTIVETMNRNAGVVPDMTTARAASGGGRYDHHHAVTSYCNNRPTLTYPAPSHRGRSRRSAIPDSAESNAPTPRPDYIYIDDNDNIVTHSSA